MRPTRCRTLRQELPEYVRDLVIVSDRIEKWHVRLLCGAVVWGASSAPISDREPDVVARPFPNRRRGPRRRGQPASRRAFHASRKLTAMSLIRIASARSCSSTSRPARPRTPNRMPRKYGPKASTRSAPGSSTGSCSGTHGSGGSSAPSPSSRSAAIRSSSCGGRSAKSRERNRWVS